MEASTFRGSRNWPYDTPPDQEFITTLSRELGLLATPGNYAVISSNYGSYIAFEHNGKVECLLYMISAVGIGGDEEEHF